MQRDFHARGRLSAHVCIGCVIQTLICPVSHMLAVLANSVPAKMQYMQCCYVIRDVSGECMSFLHAGRKGWAKT